MKAKAYAPHQLTVEQRLEQINKGNKISLAVEGRFTNLIIWKSRLKAPIDPDNTEGIYMRLDRANNYYAPLSKESHAYLDNQNTPVKELVKFEFPTSVDNLAEIIEITKNMTIRECVAW